MVSFFRSSKPSRLFAVFSTLFLLAIAAFSTLPNYWTGDWFWTRSLEPPHVERLVALQRQGLTVPGWQTLGQEVIEIGGHKWSRQAIIPESADRAAEWGLRSPIIVILRPQTWHRDQPQVDWMDINGVHQWTADSQRSLRFAVMPAASRDRFDVPVQGVSVPVEARFFRGWTRQQTYAVVQWYAWSTGGNPAPSRWFWVDQLTQWRDRHRMPWVAVSLLIPIQPLGEIEQSRSLAETLAQTIQSSLMVGALNPS